MTARDGWVRLGRCDRSVIRLMFDGELPRTVQGVADKLGYEKSTVYRSLRRLKDAGLIDWDKGHQATIRPAVRRVL